MNDSRLPIPIAPGERRLTAAEFQNLGDVPPEAEWFANIKNRSTKRAYENAIRDFIRFTGIARPEEFRTVTRARVIAWRDDLERREIGPDANKRVPEGATIRHRLAALLSLFEYLCDKNAVSHNPVKGVKRPEGRERRRKNARARRPPGPRAAGLARRGNHQGETRPRHPVDAAVPCAAAR
jgi:hypothetical protein